MRTTKILIEEDDDYSRDVMGKLLESPGYEIQTCSQGSNESKNKAIFRIITLTFAFFLNALVNFSYSKAEGPLYRFRIDHRSGQT